jgi:hypothetical protein
MTPDEAKEVLVRAREGGYFHEASHHYAISTPGSREESEAYRDIYRLARSLLGSFSIPRVTIGSTAPIAGIDAATVTISDAYWRDHILHGQWPDVLDVDDVPEDLLDQWVEKAHPIRSRFATANDTAKETT